MILFHSFKGGTGKTLTCINLAKLLAEEGNRVLLIETDFSMAAFNSIFTDQNPDMFFNSYLQKKDPNLRPYIYPDQESNLGYIFADQTYRASDKVHSGDQGWFRTKKRQLEKSMELLSDDYDFIFFDTQPGVHLFTINLISLSQTIVLLTRPDVQSMNGTNILLETVYKRAVRLNTGETPRLTLLFNQVPELEEINQYIDTWSNELKVKYSFISEINTVYYDVKTSFHTAIEQFILPKDDPTRIRLREIFSQLFEP